ncbi:MAG: MbnP family protein [Bacteroidota bacterium]
MISKRPIHLLFKGTSLCLLLILMACKKDPVNTNTDPTPTPEAKGKLNLEFIAKVDTARLAFNKLYINLNGDSLMVTKFNYFISNIVLTRSDNSVYTESESYHLVRHTSATSFTLPLSNVPVGNYKFISFMLGVDSTRNVSGTQSGDLDPVNVSDMFWSWNTGYIFLKLEGTAGRVPTSDKKFQFHIGGYGGINKTQRRFNLSFGSATANVKETATPLVQFNVDVNEIFTYPNKLDFKTQYNILNQGTTAKMVADNYADMIRFNLVQNN